ncbi:1-phosphatidylinositol-3-phosphate 5-kinase [Parastagonospora nodorum]|nr:1-phosphatidylinositol-3-phosphate 5-kinase [Parastagonospora nodorum]KAH4363431.1 1-phosphatidylinositol-3-phosphate 5-kinase [Parastagonospora nodorum]KAH4426175.1 1-phosphatidylinositol-3-phosphate 5-kinase [Parastagonospora nodorum]
MADDPRSSLHDMHATASRSDTLTTFDDLTAPPAPAVDEPKGAELVSGGLSGLYSRLRASVGGVKEQTAADGDGAATATSKAAAKLGPAPRSPGGTALPSPVVFSGPSSRLQSPSVPSFPEALPPSRDSSSSVATLPGKHSLNASKTSLATTRSRPSIAPSIEPGRSLKEEDAFAHSPTSTHSRVQSLSNHDLPKNTATKDSATGPPPANSPRFPSGKSFRDRKGDMDLVGQESDTSEDDDVVGEGYKDAAGPAGNFKFPSDTPRESLSKVSSRADNQYQTARPASKAARDQPDNRGENTEAPRITSNARVPAGAQEPQRPPLLKVGPSHLPGFRPSRASSSDGLSSVITTSTIRTPTVAPIEEIQRVTQARPAVSRMPTNAFSQMRRKILDREFWMRDENAKDCFNCGDTFTTWRRKHHCRTCGQIFDSKCTSIISGKLFGQASNIKVCKPCEAIIYGHDDDSSDFTDDGDQASLYDHGESTRDFDDEVVEPTESDHTKIGTPTISIPMSRKTGSDKKRRSHVIEVGPQTLARPSSSRSLRSLGGRPRSSSHKRHPSRHQHMRHVKHDDRAPFHQYLDNARQPSLPAFHHDNIIDPDLAPFMSDEGSSEEEQASLFATLRNDTSESTQLENERVGLGGLLAAMRKGKQRAGDRSVASGGHARDTDNISITSRNPQRTNRRRNLSVSSVNHRPSPRRSKSNSLLRPFTAGFGSQPGTPQIHPSPSPTPPGTKLTRSASMQGGITPKVELNTASLEHARKLLRQMLHDAGVSHVSGWDRALIPILRQCTDDVNPDVDRGDDIDIRNYIKLKKIPGGKPRDTAYVSGVVFSKNVALRSMPRNILNPRLVIITFAIEYARHQTHFMSLEPVIAQEREYLRNLVSRIAALRPQVLLVERNVSGLALEFLEKEGIAVVYNVKAAVLHAVARCTQSRMISSVDKLAIDPNHLGRCGSFDVKTYLHKNIRKTYVFLSGCQKDLGCTIVLRGAENEELVKLKRITEFMSYVVYNLRLETCLMRDEFIDTPTTSITGTLSSSQDEEDKAKQSQIAGGTHSQSKSGTESGTGNDQVTGNEGDIEDAAPSYYSDMVEDHRTKILSSSPFVKFMQPYLLEQARQYEQKLGQLKKLKNQYTTEDGEEDTEDTEQQFELVQPEMVHTVVQKASKQVREFLSAVHASEYDKALHHYITQKRQWETYVSGNMDLYDPFNHQKIAVLYSVVNTATSTPCIGPEIIALGFYQEHDYDDGFTPDCTLGQYVEDLCTSAGVVCEVDNCNRRMLDHSRQYVHGEGQMSVIVQKQPPKLKGLYQTILMWSCCRICGQETQTFPMSEWSWKYSFAKYLELTFWSTRLHPRADLCPHDINKDHVRYFGYNNVALRIQYDPVPLYEVTVPKPNVTWKVDSDLRLKNEQYLKIEERLDCFMNSVLDRIQDIHPDSVIPEKVDLCRKEVDRLVRRANEDHAWMRHKLQDKYMNSKYYEIIPMNRAIRAIQEKAIAWDETFLDFEQQFFPSEKDIRRLATLQLRKFFLERDESTSSLASVEEGAESGAEDVDMDEKDAALALSPMPSNMSPEKAQDMLASVVHEEHSVDSSSTEKGPASPQTPTPSTPSKGSSDLSIQTHREAIERDDVRHLDLALSSNFSDQPVSNEDLLKTPTLAAQTAQDAQYDQGSPTPTSVPKINPIDRSLAEAIENMPTSPSPQPNSNVPLESKIPRLMDNGRREAPQRPTSLIRTQSQPGNVPKHTPPSIASMLPASSFNTPKPAMSDSMRALERMGERLGMGTMKQGKSASRIPRSIPYKQSSKVSKLAEHFEQLSREFQKERMRERRADRSRQIRAYPLASSKPVVEVYRDVHEAVQEHNASDEDMLSTSPPRTSMDDSTLGDSAFHGTTPTTVESQSPVDERYPHNVAVEYSEHEEQPLTSTNPPSVSDIENDISDIDIAAEDVPLPDSIASSQLMNMSESQLESSLELPRHEKTTLLKMLTNFWSERSSSGWAPLDYPFAPMEHVWEDSDIIVREDEPSSIIALALSSPDYLTKLQSFRDDPWAAKKEFENLETRDDSIERNLLHEVNSNIRYSFTNRGVRVQCKIFFAQSFDALRRKCGVADRFVESLSRCSKWDSKGGKSKSIFLKTLDDRFVLKSLSPIEVQAFFRFAPNYFAFTHQNLFKSLPSVIAKMFGLFQVQIKSPAGRDFDWFMLVMENLFYDREPNRRYDLKGSMRNRKIQSTGERDEVLLDENLVDIIYSETPIFVREHTKKLLKASVWNDTLFLSQNNVMDYSLMAGFDDTNREIIVGIIDCIRTYTWDKKLESWIKDRGKNKPTITSPKDYRMRFRVAMEKYILQAPNCWHQFSGRIVQQGNERSRGVLEGPGANTGAGGSGKVRGHKRNTSGSSAGGKMRRRGQGTVVALE